MTTIETTITVTPDRKAVIDLALPDEVLPGRHRVVVVVADRLPSPDELAEPRPLDLIPLSFAGWPHDCTFRREELYADDDR